VSSTYQARVDTDVILHCDHPGCSRSANIDMDPTDQWLTHVNEKDVDYCPEHFAEHEGEVGCNG
jgi:hypothetical protein